MFAEILAPQSTALSDSLLTTCISTCVCLSSTFVLTQVIFGAVSVFIILLFKLRNYHLGPHLLARPRLEVASIPTPPTELHQAAGDT